MYSIRVHTILESISILQGTGVGEIRNPSDPASYGLDPKKATLKLRFRVQNNYAPIAATKNINKKYSNIEAEDENGNTIWEAVLWKGRLYVSVTAKQLSRGSKEAFIMLLEYVSLKKIVISLYIINIIIIIAI